MILQLGSLFGGALTSLFGQSAAPVAPSLLSQFGSGLATFAQDTLLPLGVQVGGNLLQGLAQNELSRDVRRAQNDAVKAGLSNAAGAASPVVAPFQGPVFSGGTPTGTPFFPPTVFPPSTLPIPQQLQVNPNFLQPAVFRGTPGVTSAGTVVRAGGLSGGPPVQAATFPLDVFSFREPVQNAVSSLLPARQDRPTQVFTGPTQMNGNALAIQGHRFTRNRQGTGSQLFVPNQGLQGANMIPLEQAMGAGIDVAGLPRFRFDQTRGMFVKVKRRRMNPCNTRAFFRAGRRIDAMERICRTLFSEKSKSKNAKVKRKSRTRKK